MAFTPTQFALATTLFGILAASFNLAAEHKKPAGGIIKVQGKGVIICQFPNDPTVALGATALVTLAISAVFGMMSLFFPYKGQSVPKSALFHGARLTVFLVITIAVTAFGEAMTLWATVTEALHRVHNVHHDPNEECATAKQGVFGGAFLLSVCSFLLWLICLMLVTNAREDYLQDEDPKGTYGQVLAVDYDANGARPGTTA